MRRFGTSEYEKCKCIWVSHKLYHMICTGAALWEPITFLQRTSSQTWKGYWSSFFCRTVITISILMKIWKRSDIKFRSLQPQFHFKFSLAIQNLGMSSIIKVWQEILLLGCKEMTLRISYSKLFIFKGRGEKNGVMGDRTVGYIQPAGQK